MHLMIGGVNNPSNAYVFITGFWGEERPSNMHEMIRKLVMLHEI